MRTGNSLRRTGRARFAPTGTDRVVGAGCGTPGSSKPGAWVVAARAGALLIQRRRQSSPFIIGLNSGGTGLFVRVGLIRETQVGTSGGGGRRERNKRFITDAIIQSGGGA